MPIRPANQNLLSGMAGKRKRKRSAHGKAGGDEKRQKKALGPQATDPVVKHALLAKYYPQVVTLREYLVSRLPPSSKIRRKKILSLGHRQRPGNRETDQQLACFLDQTLVGVSRFKEAGPEERLNEWAAFSQKPDESVSWANLSLLGAFSQTEVR